MVRNMCVYQHQQKNLSVFRTHSRSPIHSLTHTQMVLSQFSLAFAIVDGHTAAVVCAADVATAVADADAVVVSVAIVTI